MRQVDIGQVRNGFRNVDITNRFDLFDKAFRIQGEFQTYVQKQWCNPYDGRHIPAPIKTPQRCYQKVSRAYGGEFSRLVDILRATIVFRTVDNLIRAVTAISQDANVNILKVKNRFSMNFVEQGGLQSGYRDVCILLYGHRLTEGMIVEVQLNLVETFAIKSDEGHRLYKIARDSIGD